LNAQAFLGFLQTRSLQGSLINLTKAQMAWLRKHAEYSPICKPRPGVHYRDVGTLHGDGTFEPIMWPRPGSLLSNPIKLRPDGMSIGVGIKMG
jgi:hypothetical protein